MISLGWPQIVYLALSLIGLGLEIARHDEPKTGRHNAIASVIATALALWILALGGFFG